jgi:hypothetical protein
MTIFTYQISSESETLLLKIVIPAPSMCTIEAVGKKEREKKVERRTARLGEAIRVCNFQTAPTATFAVVSKQLFSAIVTL